MSWSKFEETRRYVVTHMLALAPFNHNGITSISWDCVHCAASGHGFPPEHHASGACVATKTAIIAPLPSGYVDGGGI